MEESTNQDVFSLQQFLRDDQLSMLESMMPYIGEHFRKPLALSIKFLEIKKILTEFDDEEKLSACGLENNPTNLDSILAALKNNCTPEMAEQIDQIITMRNIMKMYQTYKELTKNNPDLFSSNFFSPNQSSSPFGNIFNGSNIKNGNGMNGGNDINSGNRINNGNIGNGINGETISFIQTLNDILKTQEKDEE